MMIKRIAPRRLPNVHSVNISQRNIASKGNQERCSGLLAFEKIYTILMLGIFRRFLTE